MQKQGIRLKDFKQSIEDDPFKVNIETSYDNYWGLYFDKGNQEHEALIYSLQQKRFYEESIFLFE